MVFSPALLNRFERFYLKNYKEEELLDLMYLKILTKKLIHDLSPPSSSAELGREQVTRLLDGYLEARKEGVPLTPRNLFEGGMSV